jgi:sugar phosphate isomerase/epimerase
MPASSLIGRLDRCSINTATLGYQGPLGDTIEGVARAGFGAIAPWRREVEGDDVGKIARRIRDAGLRVSGYCRSTYMPSATKAEFDASIEDNRRALRDASTINAACFVLVVGGLPGVSRDLRAARKQVEDAIGLLLIDARECGVPLALEPLHPMYAADRSCINTIEQALDLCSALDPGMAEPLGLAIDIYHVWWDPRLDIAVARAGREHRILAFHVCDWLVPTTDMLLDRGMMGDGVVDLRSIRSSVEEAGYSGAVEAEIFSRDNWWKRPVSETLAVCKERFQTAC